MAAILNARTNGRFIHAGFWRERLSQWTNVLIAVLVIDSVIIVLFRVIGKGETKKVQWVTFLDVTISHANYLSIFLCISITSFLFSQSFYSTSYLRCAVVEMIKRASFQSILQTHYHIFFSVWDLIWFIFFLGCLVTLLANC